MRTKTLIATAALTVAGLLVSMAQDPVYSVNAVGYVNKTVGDGFTMVSNPLNNGDNTLNDTISGVTTGTTAFLWNGGGFDASTYIEGVGWAPNADLPPGSGCFIQSTGEQTITFVGEVPQGNLVNEIPEGLSIKSSIVPQAGTLAELGLALATGDIVFTWNGGGFDAATFIEGVGFAPDPVIAVAESFFVQAANAATWERDFSVND